MNVDKIAATIMSRDKYKELLEEQWLDAQDLCCSCHLNPPCDFCVQGYSLSCEEYVALALEDFDNYFEMEKKNDQIHQSDDYERAMDILR